MVWGPAPTLQTQGPESVHNAGQLHFVSGMQYAAHACYKDLDFCRLPACSRLTAHIPHQYATSAPCIRTYSQGPNKHHVVGATLHRLEPPSFLLRRRTDLIDLLFQGCFDIVFVILLFFVAR